TGHLGGRRLLEGEADPVGQPVAVGHDTGGAVLFGEVLERPDAADLDIDVGGKREEVEAPLIAMNHLRRRTRTDRDRLREVQLECRLLRPQGLVDDVEDQWMSNGSTARRYGACCGR